jgi:hypothetical protein
MKMSTTDRWSWAFHYPCNSGAGQSTYDGLDHALTADDMMKALPERAAYLESLVEKYNKL